MLDHQPRGLYSYPAETYAPQNDLIEPAWFLDSPKSYNRPAFIRELFDGPSFMNFDLSRSLVISPIKPILMTIGPFRDHAEKISFSCSPFARMSDIRKFFRERLEFAKIGRRDLKFTIGELSVGRDDDTLIKDLKFQGPQKITNLVILAYNDGDMLLGASGGGSREPAKVVPGWDMGVSMGGRLKQLVLEDKSSGIWNWKAARTINIQIINAIAFRAVTRLCPPISPFSYIHHSAIEVTATSKPASLRPGAISRNLLLSGKSVNELDWDKGAAVGVTIDGKSVAFCVCCETSICESMLDKCGHLFCRRCILYYMTENASTRCASAHPSLRGSSRSAPHRNLPMSPKTILLTAVKQTSPNIAMPKAIPLQLAESTSEH
ncbi:hypothetical protein DL98DRAFT_90748 [Cadophora sp. DSE1049]|nr:hypothetical protein DL98DRAFT_90748 [Cadophora sp. DSE1049]